MRAAAILVACVALAGCCRCPRPVPFAVAPTSRIPARLFSPVATTPAPSAASATPAPPTPPPPEPAEAVPPPPSEVVAPPPPKPVAPARDPDAAPSPSSTRPRFPITLRADGSMSFGGRDYQLESVPAPDGSRVPQTPEGHDEILAALRAALADLHARLGDQAREPSGESRIVIVIRGERAAKWKYVQWIMQVASELRIYKMHFSVVPPPPRPPGWPAPADIDLV